MCFNLKFCVPIKHHRLNIPHFFEFFFETSKHIFLMVFTGFHWMLVSVWYPPHPLRARSESCFLIGQNQTPRIIHLHRWMLPDRTAILIPFDNTCSTWVSTVRMCCVAHASFSTRFSFEIDYHFSPLLSSVSRLFNLRFPATVYVLIEG